MDMKWIPVTERLPDYRPVIVCRKNRGGGWIVEQGCREVNGWWRVYGTRTKSVLYWVPLPEPPREEEEK